MQRMFLRLTNVIETRFVFTVNSANAGTSASDQFTIPTTLTGYNYSVETSDGYTATGLTGDHTITFPSGSGIYDVYIDGDFPQIIFNNGGDKLKFLEIKNWGIYSLVSGGDFERQSFFGCTNMIITADTNSFLGINTTFVATFRNCTSLTSFPLLDFSGATNLNACWQGCSGLTSFPLLNISICTNFNVTWASCSSLTTFPALDLTSGTTFLFCWSGCTSLTNFPANMFDGCTATAFNNAFLSTNLSSTSIDNILVSINSNGTSGGTFNQTGGSAPSATGEAAIDAMRSSGWTVTVTGGY